MLVALLRECRGHLSADFRRYYGVSLTEALSGSVAPLWEVAAWASNLPPDSAVVRHLEPAESRHTPEADLLRLIEHGVRVTAWVQSSGKTRYPEPIRLPWDPPDPGRPDAYEWDELVDALGGDERLRAAMDRITAA